MPGQVLVEQPQKVTLRYLLAPGRKALVNHWKQFVLFQAIALLLVIGYFHYEPMHRVCERLSEVKQQWGLLFSAVAMIVTGVLLPEGVKALMGSKGRIKNSEILSTIVFFAINGVVTDLQYRMLAYFLGSDMSFATAVKKMLADQFVTTPTYGTTYWLVVFSWRANGYRLGPTLSAMGPRWYLTTVVPLLITGWCFWIPMTLMIYSLPGPLQFSLFAMAVAAWSLLMVSVATDRTSLEREPSL